MIFTCLLLGLSAVERITPQLQEYLEKSDLNELIRINIVMKDRFDPQEKFSDLERLERTERREFAVSQLKDFTESSQRDILNFLNSYQVTSKVENIKSLWINNTINCYAQTDIIELLAERTDILSVDLDEMRQLISPQPGTSSSRTDREITWNVTKVQADDVWDLGYTGAGVTVAVLDTGVNYNHVDLNDHLWENPDYPCHGYDFINNDMDPMDDHGHGTHCAGTVAGDGTAGSQTGMAPDATIMCLKILDNTGNGNESASWAAVQFAVEQGADVMSMSFGWQHNWGVNREGWRDAMNSALYAGVVASVAAGNEGNQLWYYPIPDNVRTPGDCPPPWLHPDQTLEGGVSSVICVGATDSNDNIANFSSRGPVTWQDVTNYCDYPYNPGIGLIRPDISAPGVNIKSLSYSSNSGYLDGWDGTSMATPCVAGVIALMISKDFTLTPQLINQIVELNCDLPQNPKNNIFGSGRINALASVNAVTMPDTPPNPVISPNPVDGSEFNCLNQTLTWMNGGGASSYAVFFGTDNPPSNLINGEVVATNSYLITDQLTPETQYFWKIDAINEFGTTPGSIWNFYTLPEADESYTTGDFSAFQWLHSGDEMWQIVEEDPFYDTYCARSGTISQNQNSTLSIHRNVLEESILTFHVKTSCQEPAGQEYYDYLGFSIDDVLIEKYAGQNDWQMKTFTISPGVHTFSWNYHKDNSNSGGEDCVWLDYIIFPTSECVGPGTVQGQVTLDPPGDLSLVEMTIGVYQITLDEQGCYSLELPFGNYDIALSYPGYFNYDNTIYLAPNETITLDILLEKLPVPYDLQAEVVDHTVNLTWQDPEADESRNILYYKIYRNQNGGNFSFIYATVYEYFCETLTLSGNYGYRVTAMYANNCESDPSEIVYAEITETNEYQLPVVTTFSGNHPNPFNPSTTFHYSLKEILPVKLTIYNLKGEIVNRLISEVQPSGYYEYTWNGKNMNGETLGSGIYFSRFQAGSYSAINKLLIMK